MKTLIEQNPQQSVSEMSQIMVVNISTLSDHHKRIGKMKNVDKEVPHELSERQRFGHFEECPMLHLRNSNEVFLDRIVTCDKK